MNSKDNGNNLEIDLLVDDGIEGVDGAMVPAAGFPIRRRNSQKDDYGVLRYIVLTCSREGGRIYNTNGSLKPQATMQTGCKARLTASSDACGIWRINTINLKHNHKTSPSKSRLYRCNRELSAHVKRRLEVNDMAGIPLHKSYNSTVIEAGGYENMTCVEKDCRNYVEKVSRLRLGEGDAVAIQAYFSKMQSRCPGFYFSMDLDEESRLRNIFWAHNRSRQAYKEFGDVVTFDTTYLTNKYEIPFAPFVGVNHHGQSILLGCGLVANEITETYVWLFRTSLQCMYGQAPKGIITDQDRAMQNAIQIVFPNTRHRWCLWHILKKLPEKFGYHVDKSAIFSRIHVLVYDSQTIVEFEEGWGAMINIFNLGGNDWLATMYANRSRWVPCYLKNSFWAGMSTTQRSESMNVFFDGYVNSKTSLKQFVEQYERALSSKVEKEFQTDFKCFSQMVPCATKFEMEKQFQATYTISKFREVQDEFIRKVYCDLTSVTGSFSSTMYEVVEDVIRDEHEDKKKFFVTFQKGKCEIVCTCHLFEFRGIICRHAIAVLIRNNVKSLPDTYILRRWRRDVSRAYDRVAVNYDGLSSTPRQLRYDNMCQTFSSLADMTANDDKETREILEWIECKMQTITMCRSICGRNNIPQIDLENGSSQHTSMENIHDPLCSKRKGAPKKLRKKGPLESSSSTGKAKGRRPRAPTRHMRDGAPIPHARPQPQYIMPSHILYSQLLQGDDNSLILTQYLGAPNFTTTSPTTVILDAQVGNAMQYYCPNEPDQDGGIL